MGLMILFVVAIAVCFV